MSSDTRDRLLAAGLRTLLINGYEGAGLSAMLAEAEVPKGSFYHFFHSKDDFVLAILNNYAQRYAALRSKVFSDSRLTPIERVFEYFRVLEVELIEDFPAGGCLYGVLSQTHGVRSKALRTGLLKMFRASQAAIEAALCEAQHAGELRTDIDVRELAVWVWDAYEGVLVRVKAENDPRAFRHFVSHLRRLLK